MPALAPVSVTLFGKGSGSRDDISWTIGADPKSDDSGPYKRKAEGKFGSGRRGEHREESPREDGSRDWRMRPRTHEHLEPQKLEETRPFGGTRSGSSGSVSMSMDSVGPPWAPLLCSFASQSGSPSRVPVVHAQRPHPLTHCSVFSHHSIPPSLPPAPLGGGGFGPTAGWKDESEESHSPAGAHSLSTRPSGFSNC